MNENSCNESSGKNIKTSGKDTLINCRNVWFREFWSQHHKCYFDTGNVMDLPPEIDKMCSGEEKLQNYEEEGLVPFVGKYQNFFFPFTLLTFFLFPPPPLTLSFIIILLLYYRFLLINNE